MIRRTNVFSSIVLALSVLACAGPAPTTVLVTATEGGTVTAITHQIVIPAMALPSDTEVTLTTAPASDYPALPGAGPEVLVMEPVGTTLSVPSLVTIDAEFIGGAPTDTVMIHQLQMVDGTRWVLLPSERGASGDVVVSVSRFAPLAVVVPTAAGGSGIRGIIRWGDGSVVPMAPIALFSGTSMVSSTTSDASGAYSFGDLAAGSYRVVVMYECNIDQPATVTAGAFTTLDLTLCGG